MNVTIDACLTSLNTKVILIDWLVPVVNKKTKSLEQTNCQL